MYNFFFSVAATHTTRIAIHHKMVPEWGSSLFLLMCAWEKNVIEFDAVDDMKMILFCI